jgi:hypothetical protein
MVVVVVAWEPVFVPVKVRLPVVPPAGRKEMALGTEPDPVDVGVKLAAMVHAAPGRTLEAPVLHVLPEPVS